ncbi:MAG: AMP-binding protein [Gemmatimonadota bacterium]
MSPAAFPISGPGFAWSAAEVADRVAGRAAALAADLHPGRPWPVPAGQTAADVIEALAVWAAGGVLAPLHPDLPPAQRDRALGALEACPALPEGSAAVVWTSGTSGRPTGVVLGWAGLEHVARSAGTRLGVGSEDVWAHTLSPATMGGLATLVRARTLGHGLRVEGPFRAEGLSAALDSGAVTFASLVPIMLDRLLQARRGRPFPHIVRGLLLGGAATPRSLVEAALALDAPLFLTYGMTEASSQVATAGPDLVRAVPGTVGAPLDGVEVRIGAGGVIQVRSPGLALARIVADPVAPVPDPGPRMPDTGAPVPDTGPPVPDPGPPVPDPGPRMPDTGAPVPDPRPPVVPEGQPGGGQATAAPRLEPLASTDGWYRTGDLGHLDGEGRLFVTGRAAERIISGGATVDPLSVEGVLLHHPDVADVCVVGAADPEWGERVVALLVPAPGSAQEALADRLTTFARLGLRPPERPRDWVFVDVLPRNRGGKLDRREALRIVRERLG